MRSDNETTVNNLNRIIEKECSDIPILESEDICLENKFFIAINMLRFLAHESTVGNPENNIERASQSNRAHLGREAGLTPINDFLDKKASQTAIQSWVKRVDAARKETAEKFPQNKASEDSYAKQNILSMFIKVLGGRDLDKADDASAS